MAIKINLMPEAQKRGWQIPQGDLHLYSVTFFLFFLSLLIFSGTYIYKVYYLQKQLTEARDQDAKLTQTILSSLDSKMISVGKKAGGVETLLKDHLYWSKYFEILETFTLKNNFYDQFSVRQDSLNSSSLKASISGHADNFNVFAKQIAIFMTNKEFSSVKFDGGNIDKDGIVNFKVDLEINSDNIKYKEEKSSQ